MYKSRSKKWKRKEGKKKEMTPVLVLLSHIERERENDISEGVGKLDVKME